MYEPFCSLLVAGVKQFETRNWPTSYRGPIALHAASDKRGAEKILRWQPDLVDLSRDVFPDRETLADYPLGCVVGIGRLVACHAMTDALIAEQGDTELICGLWEPGRFAFEIRDIIPLDDPIPARGGQRFWEWEGP